MSFRLLKRIDQHKFHDDVSNALNTLPTDINFKTKVELYNSAMKQIMDIHAPIKTKMIKQVPTAQWFDSEYSDLRRLRRRAERRYRRSNLQSDKQEFLLVQKKCVQMSLSKKRSYIATKLNANTSSREVYHIVNQLLDNCKDTVLPDCNSDFELATKFRDFFSNKVKAIRESIPTSSISHEQSSLAGGIVPLNHFAPATLDELRSIISKYSIKCSPEDPLPATVMKKI